MIGGHCNPMHPIGELSYTLLGCPPVPVKTFLIFLSACGFFYIAGKGVDIGGRRGLALVLLGAFIGVFGTLLSVGVF